MSEQTIKTERDGAVLMIRLDRPERKNALNLAMYDRLNALLTEASNDPGVRAVLVASSNDAFCAGNDLKDFVEHPPRGQDSPAFRFLFKLLGFEKPLLAAVGGVAVGIGSTMLLHCDLAYASDEASFSFPFTKLGLVPEAASTYLLPRLAGHARAAELLLLAEPFDAKTALEIGLINARVPHSELEAHALEQARKLAALPPASLRATKALMRESCRAGARRAMEEEVSVFVSRLASPESAEALTAFFEKREADFSRFE